MAWSSLFRQPRELKWSPFLSMRACEALQMGLAERRGRSLPALDDSVEMRRCEFG